MLKIFVTGDNHIGKNYSSHEKAEKLASSRIDAFRNMVDKANAENCDLFVITGDLFEKRTGIAKKDIIRLVKILADFTETVVILPGNHDFYDEDNSLWKNFQDIVLSDGGSNILLLTEYRTYPLAIGEEKVILYPALCTSRHSDKNNLDWIKNETIVSNGTYHIGIAHGAVEGETIDSEGKYFLMTRKELQSIPVDLWLIGHTHVPFPHNLTEEYTLCQDKIFNAGTHIQTDVNNNTEGVCFLIKTDNDKKIFAKKYISGNLRFCRKTVTLYPNEMEHILSRELKALKKDTVADIILQGAVSDEEYEMRTDIFEEYRSRFIEFLCNDSDLSRQITKERIEKEYAETSFIAKFLTGLLDNPKEVQLAYDMVQKLKDGGKK